MNTMVKGSAATTHDLIEQVAEELWQKGYDLQKAKANGGWLIREPMGGQSLTLASNAALLEYAAGRVPMNIPADERAGTVAPVAANRTSAPAPGAHHAGHAWQERRVFAIAGIVGLCVLIGIWMSMVLPKATTSPMAPKKASASGVVAEPLGDVSAHGGPESPDRRTPDAMPEALRARGDATSAGDGSLAAVSATTGEAAQGLNGKDVSELSDSCLAQLKQKFRASDLTLLVRSRRTQAETCYIVHGREHCPYFTNGHAVFNYLNLHSGMNEADACDIDVAANSTGNLRVVQTNPDIVRFLISGTSPADAPGSSFQAR